MGGGSREEGFQLLCRGKSAECRERGLLRAHFFLLHAEAKGIQRWLKISQEGRRCLIFPLPPPQALRFAFSARRPLYLPIRVLITAETFTLSSNIIVDTSVFLLRWVLTTCSHVFPKTDTLGASRFWSLHDHFCNSIH